MPMNEPLFTTLSREEFNELGIEDRLSYMRRLMADMQKTMDETRRSIERTKAILAESKPKPL
jgi:hypothetical protein